jgi:hypothetical protein
MPTLRQILTPDHERPTHSDVLSAQCALTPPCRTLDAITYFGGHRARAPTAALAAEVPPRPTKTIYPEPFASRVAGREKRVLGDLFGLQSFGVNLTRLAPGSMSALRHAHAKQD